jgi:hypothetical protein
LDIGAQVLSASIYDDPIKLARIEREKLGISIESNLISRTPMKRLILGGMLLRRRIFLFFSLIFQLSQQGGFR